MIVVVDHYFSQLDDQATNSVIGNFRSIIAFPAGTEDAARLAEQMSKHPVQLTPKNLTGLPKYTAYIKLLIDSMPSGPFSMGTMQPK